MPFWDDRCYVTLTPEPPTKHSRAVVLVARYNSFITAAADLGKSQPALDPDDSAS